MLEEIKKELINIALEAEKEGLCKHKSGNFSAFDETTNYIVISPTGVNRQNMSIDDIIVIDRQGHIIESKNGLMPTSEVLMHLSAYEARNDIRAVVHTHSVFATVMAVLEETVPAVVIEAAHLALQRGYIPVAELSRQGTEELARSVKEPLSFSDTVLLSHHGVLTVGESLEKAFLKAVYTEEMSKIYYHARLLKSDIKGLPLEDLILRYPTLK